MNDQQEDWLALLSVIGIMTIFLWFLVVVIL